MDPVLALIGLAKLAFGVFVGVVGISVAARLTARLSGFDNLDDGLRAQAMLRLGSARVGTEKNSICTEELRESSPRFRIGFAVPTEPTLYRV